MRTFPLVVAACLVAFSFPRIGAAQDQAPAKPLRNVSGGVLRTEQACFDVLHYTLRLAVDPTAKTIDGTVQMRARCVAAAPVLLLDLDPALAVHAVRLGGKDVPYTREGGLLRLTPATAPGIGGEFTVDVDYGGAPRVAVNPPWDGGFTWSQTKDGKPWIATSCQGEGADLWWPCKDHPSDKPDGFDLHVRVPDGLVVASNGVLVGEPQRGDRGTSFHWQVKSPIANYNIALNIAPYVELKERYTCIDGTVMPIQFFVLPDSAVKARRCMPQFLDHLRVFEELLGPYPFRHEKYGIAETPHLGMEHQTIIAYGNGFTDEQYDWLHNHELAHEWWGNLVTCRDWKDMWLHEGFGTYMQPLYREKRFGRKAYDQEIAKYRTMNRSPVAPRDSKTSFEIYFGGGGSNDIYYKGAAILHTLRWQLGDERFFQALRRFCYPTEAAVKATDGSQVRFVDTEDFVRLCSDVAGEDLGWFFAIYVRQPALPKLEHTVQDGVLQLRWVTPDNLPFPLAVPVTLRGAEVRVPMADGVGSLRVDDAEYAVDPQQRLLKARTRNGR